MSPDQPSPTPAPPGDSNLVRRSRRSVAFAAAALVVALVLVSLSFWSSRPRSSVPVPALPPPPVPGEDTSPPASPRLPTLPEGDEQAAQPEGREGTVIRLSTTKGDLLVELFDREVPITAGNFLLLAESGYYDGVTFHRVVPNFVIQGGDPTGTGMGGPGFTIPDELKPHLKHDRGMLSMAKTAAPDTGGSQFFVCTGGPGDVGHLDMRHSVFGRVLEGMDVVDRIGVGDRMTEVKVEELSPHAPAAREAAEAARVKD